MQYMLLNSCAVEKLLYAVLYGCLQVKLGPSNMSSTVSSSLQLGELTLRQITPGGAAIEESRYKHRSEQ